MLNLKLLTLAVVGIGMGIHSSTAIADPSWNRLLRDYKMNPEHHAFCFTGENGEVKGSNQHMKVRTASVSKLITTLWAMDKNGPHYQYETKIYIKPNGKAFDIHLKGSKDTVFSKRKMFHLVNQLHLGGFDQIKTLTFNDQTLAFSKAEDYVGDLVKMTPERTAKNLFDFLHTKEWNLLLPVYREYFRTTPQSIREKFLLESDPKAFNLAIGEVKHSAADPFDITDPQVKELSLLSPFIEDYMKFMNIVSNNYIADQTFENLGGEEAFDSYVKEFLDENFQGYNAEMTKFNANELPIKMFTGSGLNTVRAGARVDNYATCAVVVKLIEKLKNKMEELDSKIELAVAVPGSDGGTFRSRLNSPRLKNTMIAKTGTLYHTSALAGMISTKSGLQYFGVFHQLQGAKGNAQIVQNSIVRQLIDNLGGEAPFDYTPTFFYPISQE